MNKRIIIYILGWVLIIEAAAMQIGTITSLIYGEHEALYFLFTGIGCAILGLLAVKVKKPKNMVLYQKAGFAATALSWIVLSLAGCLPFWLSGEIPSFIDAFFETVSGFTTTGATILTDVESLSHGMLMWRSFSNWLGGMGVIVFLLAIIPKLGGQQNIFLMKAESPGPIVGKAVPKMRHYAMMLYAVYIVLTLVEFIMLICGGMGVFDAINISFATGGTGGFSITNSGIAAYDSYYLQIVIAVFMILFGLNFSFYLLLLARKFSQAFRIEEIWVYFGITVVVTAIVAVNLSSVYSLPEAIHQSFFSVSAVITTTGFSITDINQWPELSKMLILLVSFIGATAGSTGCGFKISRVILLFKEVKKEFSLLVHPRNIKAVKMDGKTVNHDVMRSTSMFLVVYIGIFAAALILISLENKDFITTFTSVAATLNNTGPGFGAVGPTGNYADFSILSKCVFIFNMLAGRLELFPLLLLFSPSAWKKA